MKDRLRVVVEGELSAARLTPAARIRSVRVRWAWALRVPLGAVTVLAGDPGLGKSTITMELAARWSRGQAEGDLLGTPVPVAIATAEDNWATTVRPRLEAAGADLDLVLRLEMDRADGSGDPTFPDDLPEVERALAARAVRVVIVDPFVAHLPPSVNSWRDQDVRRALAPLRRLAEGLDAAVVGVLHLNKRETGALVARVSGSIGMPAAARSLLVVAPDPEDPSGSTRLLAHGKSNLGPEAPAKRFRIEGRWAKGPDGEDIATSGIAWCGEVRVNKADLLSADGHEDRTARREAAGFLRELLAEGPVPAEEVKREAAAAGIAWATVRRAKAELGVASKKQRFGGAWVWSLPSRADGGDVGAHEDAQYTGGEHLWTGTGVFPQFRPKVLTSTGGEHLREPPEEEEYPPEDLPPDDEPGNPDGAPLFDDGPLVEPPEDEEESAEETVLEDVGGAGAPPGPQGPTRPRPPDPRRRDWREERLAALRPYVERYRRQFPNWRDEDIALNLGDFEPPPGFVGWTGHAVRVVMGEAEPPWTRS
ncbi:MAG TPA: AAA family ATPase [Actinomycetota bacterium]|nr:AAA family ATPase [Actinomycetota bacterium]